MRVLELGESKEPSLLAGLLFPVSIFMMLFFFGLLIHISFPIILKVAICKIPCKVSRKERDIYMGKQQI